jgi:hypothetical protein
MRIYTAIIAVLACAGCDYSKPCNPQCGDHERCVDGACHHCGEPGETCCQPSGHFECNDGVVCDNTHDPICTTSCGMAGLPCCEGTCPPDSASVCGPQNVCVASCNGNTPHTFSLVDDFGCVWGVHPFTSGPNPGDAETCAQVLLPAYDPDHKYHLGQFDTDPDCKDLCELFQGNYTQVCGVCAFGQQALDTCAQSLCEGCDSWSFDPACPATFTCSAP